MYLCFYCEPYGCSWFLFTSVYMLVKCSFLCRLEVTQTLGNPTKVLPKVQCRDTSFCCLTSFAALVVKEV